MEANRGASGRVSVIIERGAGRVFVDGREVALPPNEFRLLLTLAEAPGEAASATELIQAVWGPDSGMSSNDLYWIVWKLRGRIGDEDRPKRVVANRKGHGYLIDLSVADLVVVDVAGTDLIAPVTQNPESADEADQDGDPVPGADEGDPPGSETLGEGVNSFAGSLASEDGTISPASQVLGAASRAATAEENARRRRRLLLAACLVTVACAAGFTARSLLTTPPPSPKQPGFAQAEPSPDRDKNPGTREKQRERQPASTRKKPHDKPDRAPSSGGGGPVAAAPLLGTAPPTGGFSTGPGGAQPGPKVKRVTKPPAPDLPPPPTRYLYHLYNPENGDHLVTTDGGVVTEHEAKGYEGGAIGRVYVTQEKDTFAIPTNFGTAYVFAHASPKTDPASPVVALWLAQKDGDFFYTTSKSEASKDGWSASPSGYVRTL